jgi:hypothetical protein
MGNGRRAWLAAAAALAGLTAPALAQEDVPDGPQPGGRSTMEERGHDHGLRELLDTLEIVDTPVYSRNQLQTKLEWTEKQAGAATTQLMVKPVFAWGQEREFALRIEAPVEFFQPGPGSGQVPASGFASLTTTFFWAFYEWEGLRQSLGLEVQWNTASNPAVGAPWILEPVYGIGYHFGRWVGLTLELNWQKSFGNLGGYLPVNTIQFKPVVSVALPAWFFVSVQDKTSWSLESHDVGSLLKITAGRFLTERKTVVLAVEYETPLDPVAAQAEVMMAGVFLSYFYSW